MINTYVYIIVILHFQVLQATKIKLNKIKIKEVLSDYRSRTSDRYILDNSHFYQLGSMPVPATVEKWRIKSILNTYDKYYNEIEFNKAGYTKFLLISTVYSHFAHH